MGSWLEPVFGETGALIAQFIIAFAVILALIGAVVWLVRRYGVGGIGHAGRGRLPRLAIVDALVIDNRRRLVLVRRDNVEHLILIGGTTDFLVEPSIVRTRVAQRPGQPAVRPATATAAAAPPPPAAAPVQPAVPVAAQKPEPMPTEEPIPFPRRPAPVPRAAARPAVRREAPRPVARPVAPPETEADFTPNVIAEMEERAIAEEAAEAVETPPVPSARFAPTSRPTRVLPAPVEVDEDFGPPPVLAPPPAELPQPFAEVIEDVPPQSDDAEEMWRAPPVAPEPEAVDEPPPLVDEEADTAAKVSDLEKEMARLLGEISNRR